MQKFLLSSIITVSLLAGCASTSPEVSNQDQYCYTNETVKDNDGLVSSQTTIECSDDPLKRAKLVGVDPKYCRRWERRGTVNGYEKQFGGFICRDEKGNWRPLSQY